MKALKLTLIFVIMISFVSCSIFGGGSTSESIKKIPIQIQNNLLMHEGLGSLLTVVTGKGYHKFIFWLKSDKEMEISSISISIQNQKNGTILQDVYVPKTPIHLKNGWDWEEVKFESKKYGIFSELCSQFKKMGDADGSLFTNSVSMSFKTSNGEVMNVKDVVLKFRDDTFFSKVIKAIQKFNCDSIEWFKALIGM